MCALPTSCLGEPSNEYKDKSPSRVLLSLLKSSIDQNLIMIILNSMVILKVTSHFL
jgi:hypothetical protein